jgi:uncharacterized membrane protein YhhN
VVALLALAAAGAVAYLCGHALDLKWLALAGKPIPVLCMVASLAPWRGAGARLVAAGLLAGVTGDVLLELPGRFVPGLSAFLLGHLAYVAAFVLARRDPALGRLAVFAAWAGGVYAFLLPGLGAMALPVGAYVCVIGVMMWRAAALAGTPEGRRAAVGAVLFGLSDTLIALDRFHEPIPGVRYPIILLYWAGQLGVTIWARSSAARGIGGDR